MQWRTTPWRSADPMSSSRSELPTPGRRGSSRRVAACMAAALLVMACSQDPTPGTPEAAALGERLMRSMSDTLARSTMFSFETSERMEVIAPGGEKQALHFTRKVSVRRPSALFFELHETGGTRLAIAAYYDGGTITVSESPDGAWAQATVPGTLDEMLDYVIRTYGLPVPIGDLASSSPYDAFIGSSTRGGFVGRETIDGVECVKLDYADAVVQVRLWLPASGAPLPRRVEIVYRQAPGSPTTQLNVTNWQLDAPITDATFAFQAPAGREPVDFGEFVAGMVSRIIPSGQPTSSPATPGAQPTGEPATR